MKMSKFKASQFLVQSKTSNLILILSDIWIVQISENKNE